jgi:hypothetical protein
LGLLVVLMLTGMPISISLGLTVLSFLFFLTEVPIESVALKLFTGIEKFEIMAIPFFILAGNFLTHGGVARRMIAFATSMVGHWHGGLGLGGVLACALVCGGVGLQPGHGGGDWLHFDAGHGQGGFPQRFWCRGHYHLGCLGYFDTTVDRDGDVFGLHQHLGGGAVHGGCGAGHRTGISAGPDHLVPRQKEQLPLPAQGQLG